MTSEITSEKGAQSQTTVGKFIFYATIASGLIAAYLMYRRGESLGTIARKTIANPIGSMVTEVKNSA